MPHLHGQREKEDQGGGKGKITGKLLRLTVKFTWGGCMAASAGREGKHDGVGGGHGVCSAPWLLVSSVLHTEFWSLPAATARVTPSSRFSGSLSEVGK